MLIVSKDENVKNNFEIELSGIEIADKVCYTVKGL